MQQMVLHINIYEGSEELTEELARGLAYLHQENVIHRDIKELECRLDGGLHAQNCVIWIWPH